MPGRNDPCPCGSGKKYKKCCLEKDRDDINAKIVDEKLLLENSESYAAKTPIPPQKPKPAEILDPHLAAVNARWEEFEQADDDDRGNVFLKTLDESGVMDDELAFEMLNSLLDTASTPERQNQYSELIDRFRERLPEVYNESCSYYLLWRISLALNGHQPERLQEFTREIAEIAGEHVESYHQALSMLAYHGKLSLLSEASQIAWPHIKTSENILSQSLYADWGVNCAIFQRLESSPQFDSCDSELIEQAKFYFEKLPLNILEGHVARISGATTRAWSLDDFDFKLSGRSKRKNRDVDATTGDNAPSTGRQALADMLDEFVDYAHRQEGIPYTKAVLAQKNIFTYLMERYDGDLEPRQSMFEVAMNPDKKPKPKRVKPAHPLCPDRQTLERFFERLMRAMPSMMYDGVATFELMPTWLRFLETRGLIDSSRRELTLADIGGIQATLLAAWKDDHRYRDLAENIQAWPENAARPCGPPVKK